MAYGSKDGKRSMEFASKINHSAIIQSEEIQTFLATCDYIDFDIQNHNLPEAIDIQYRLPQEIKHIFAIDGSYSEAFIKKQYPSVSLTYFNIGVLSFEMRNYDTISANPLIDPAELKKLKKVSKTAFAIPTKKLNLKSESTFTNGVRSAINNIFCNKAYSSLKTNPLYDTLEWVIFEMWGKPEQQIDINCIDDNCHDLISFKIGEREKKCPHCGERIYLSDFLRLDALINEVTGSAGINAFLCAVVEQLYMAEIIKYFYENNKSVLSTIAFIKDGALAFFSKTFLLTRKFRNLMKFLSDNKIDINIVGLEKSGTFKDHACLIASKLEKGKYYICNEEYIRKYIEPQETKGIYGYNTYYGKKVMFKTEAGDVLIAVLPVKEYKANNNADELLCADICLNIVSKLRCNMYDDSLVPVAIINKLVSIAAMPSSNILEKFTKTTLAK
jgi:hypothetical protein